MKARDIVIDFINYVFFFFLIVYFIFYVLLGEKYTLIMNIMKAVAPLSYFALFFIFKFRFAMHSIRRMEREETIDEEVIRMTPFDKTKDWAAITILPILMLLIPLYMGHLNFMDLMQALAVFITMMLAHKLLFLKKDRRDKGDYLTNYDRIIDGIIIFFLPIEIIGLSLLFHILDVVDVVQAIAAFLMMYLWHIMLFKKL